MRYWRIENLTTHSQSGAKGTTFAEACDKLGWNPNDCKVVQVW